MSLPTARSVYPLLPAPATVMRWTVLSAFFLFVGCSSTSDGASAPDPALTEIPISDAKAEDSSEIELYNRGRYFFENRLYSDARQKFEAIINNYPLGPYALFASVKNADAAFANGAYATAAPLYEEIFKSQPASDAAPYALFKAGRSFQLSQRGIGRDMAAIEKSVALYDKFLDTFPDSPYTRAVIDLRKEAYAALVKYEETVATFYRKKSSDNAAMAREVMVDRQLAQQDSRRLPTDPAIELAQLRALHQTLPALREESDTPASQYSQQQQIPEQERVRYHLERVECVAEPASVVLSLDQEMADPEFLSEYREVESAEGELHLPLPETASVATSIDCFGEGDLTVSTNGTVSIKGDDLRATMIPISNPPRLLLLLE